MIDRDGSELHASSSVLIYLFTVDPPTFIYLLFTGRRAEERRARASGASGRRGGTAEGDARGAPALLGLSRAREKSGCGVSNSCRIACGVGVNITQRGSWSGSGNRTRGLALCGTRQGHTVHRDVGTPHRPGGTLGTLGCCRHTCVRCFWRIEA